MKESAQIIALFDEQQCECALIRTSYEIWLSVLTPLRWFMVGGAAVMSALAGFTALRGIGFFADNWPHVSAIFAFSATILITLHTLFKCDEHQLECRNKIQAYSALETGYQAAKTIGNLRELALKRDELSCRLEELKMNTEAAPANWCRQCAAARLSGED